ncbi:energy transducer TonB [Polaribacter sp. MSW13]|uniref:Energy transducer TonB n=1 Tax=Polaribacter marinus TaxID=2916838 RepID=A0A9X2AJB0_9FLAO|nr:energy transducer TonB [Polaribacter marinus]MCI2229346.1 energy transducer TonB [Polaribacter marinus]
MEIKKNPKSNLENYSKIFMQIGLVLALFVTYAAIEKKTYDRTYGDLGTVNMNAEMEEDIPITERVEPVKPKTPPPPAPEKIEIVEDEKEIEETVIESTETDETVAVEVEEIEEVEEVEEVIEDVSFMIIEDVPVFPGCKGNKAELKKCFSKMIQKHFLRKFDAELPNELGLSSGKKKVYIGFKIDKNGNVVNINARAPHPKIKSEVIKVMKQLPKMKPGKQRGKPVGVKYSIPFTLIVE